jgi:oxidoreductase
MFLYPKSKGLTEEALGRAGYSQTIIFRPGFLEVPGGRKEARILENIFG